MEMENEISLFWVKYGALVVSLGRKLIIAVLIIIAGVIIIRLSRRLTQRAVKGKLHADENLASMLRLVIQYGIILICLIMILDLFGVIPPDSSPYWERRESR